MRQFLVGLLFLAALPAGAASLPTEDALAERVLGRAEAPVTVIEYASLTCPHCADFHGQVLPDFKKDYIDTGKAKLVYRDYPLDAVALAAAMVARCAPKDRYFGFLDVLYRSQPSWAQSANPQLEIERVARLGGLSKADFDACLDNQALMKGIQIGAERGRASFNVESTPTVIVDGKKYTGRMTARDLGEAVDKIIAAKR